MESDIRELLESEAQRINSPEFIDSDPVLFPRRFETLQDIEIAALLSATISWGNRKMICRNCDKMLSMMGGQPFRFVMDKGYEDLDDETNIHRTFFVRNLKHYLRGLHEINRSHGSLQEYARHIDISSSPFPAWRLMEGINNELQQANGGACDSRCLPSNLGNTALKRVNMALRWLVRNDRIVDMGVWDVITPAQLFIPLDVHVGDTARELGLLTRKANDRRSVEEVTSSLREICPDDPVKFDYALFGIGMKL